MKKVFLLFSLIGLMIAVNSARADHIEVTGNVSGYWNADTVKVIGDITVPGDSTLIIEAGVLVEFYGHYKITVRGNVIAAGNEGHLVRFTVSDTAGFADTATISGGWHGFEYDNLAASADSSKFSYCVFEYGKAVDSGTAGRYGGVFRIFTFSRIRFTSCRFLNNYAYHWGGAMYVKQSDIRIEKSVFISNRCGQAGIPYGYGGALCFVSSEPLVFYNYFENNSSTGIGGAASFEYSDAVVQYNTFYKNKSALGGAIGYMRSHPRQVVSNNLVDQNQALYFGGGIACIRAHTVFVNNTVVNNSSVYGGGFYANDSASPANYNTIFYGNFAYEGVEVYIWDVYSAPDFYYCNVPGGKEGFSGSGGHEGYHGIFVFNMDTVPMFTGAGDHPYSLNRESPMVDAGTPDTVALQIPLMDFGGNPRIYNDRIDIGAYECNPGEGVQNKLKEPLLSAFPNPCDQNTVISFTLFKPGKVNLRIFDQNGKLIRDLGARQFNAGKCSVNWDLFAGSGEKAVGGIYFCVISGDHLSGSVEIIIIQ